MKKLFSTLIGSGLNKLNMLFVCLYIMLQCISITAFAGYTDSVLMTKTANWDNPENYITRIIRGSMSNELFSLPTGVNEFDCRWDNKYNKYRFIYNPRSDEGTHYREAATLAGLATASDTVIRTNVFEWPSLLIDGDILYCYGHTDTGTVVISAPLSSGAAGLVAATNARITTNMQDFSVQPFFRGGFIASYKNGGTGDAGIMTSFSPTGPWTDQGYINNYNHNPPFADREKADGFVFQRGSKLFYIYSANARGSVIQRPVIVEISPLTFKAWGQPALIAQPGDKQWQKRIIKNTSDTAQKLFNGVAVQGGPEGEVILTAVNATYYGGNELSDTAGIGYLSLSDDVTPTGRAPYDVLRIKAGNRSEINSNIPISTYGIVSNTTAGGFQAASGGGWGYLNLPNVSGFSGALTFQIDAVPADSATIISLNSGSITNASQITFRVKNVSGVAKLQFIMGDSLGDLVIGNGSTAISLGVKHTIIFIFNDQNPRAYLDGQGSPPEMGMHYYNTIPPPSQLREYSLLNNKTDSIPAGNQLSGRVYDFYLKQDVSDPLVFNSDNSLSVNYKNALLATDADGKIYDFAKGGSTYNFTNTLSTCDIGFSYGMPRISIQGTYNSATAQGLYQTTSGSFHIFSNDHPLFFLSAPRTDFTNNTVAGGPLVMGLYGNGNVTIGGSSDPGVKLGIDGAVKISNVSAAPATPASGGIIYCMGGALYYKGSNGTVTTLAVP